MDANTYMAAVKDVLKPIIKNDIAAGYDRPLNQYMDRALEVVKNNYKSNKGMKAFGFWSGQNKSDIVHLWEDLSPQVVTLIESLVKEFRSKKMMKEIKAASAKALVKEAMEQAGLDYKFEGQAYRAKISVLLAPGRALTVYIAYSKINEQLAGVVESLKVIVGELEKLGKNFSINKVYWA